MSAIITIDRTQIVGIPAGNGAIFSAATPTDVATTLGNQTANKFYSGPVTGAASAPTFRAINSTDLGYTATGQILYNRSDGTMTPLTIGSSGQVLTVAGGVPTYATPTTGTVTSVALSVPSPFTISGSPVTGAGTLTVSLANQTANTFYAGPSSGSAAAAAFRAMAVADLPAIGSSGQVTYNNAGVMAGATNMTYTTTGLGLFTTTPTNALSFGNGAAREVWIENSATDVVGRALTVAAGSTVAGTSTSNVVGGNLVLQSGLGTGTGASNILFQTGTTLTTGTTLQTISTKMTLDGTGNLTMGTGGSVILGSTGRLLFGSTWNIGTGENNQSMPEIAQGSGTWTFYSHLSGTKSSIKLVNYSNNGAQSLTISGGVTDYNNASEVAAQTYNANQGTHNFIGNSYTSSLIGNVAFMSLAPSYNQTSGTYANTDLLINRTQTAVGSGTQLLIDAQVGGVSKHSVTNTGNLGILVQTPTNELSFGNAAARKMWIENSATDVVGRALTVSAGSTVAGTSVNDVTGGNLVIQSGLGTGTSSSMISFQTGAALTTGKVLQTMTEQFQVFSGGVVSRGVVRLKGYTVATLPTGTQGDTVFCTDLLAPAFYSGTSWAAYGESIYNVKLYGAKGDGVQLADGAMTSSSAVLTSASASFSANDVGKLIVVAGAGATGVDLSTTILSRQSSAQVTLSATAGTTITGSYVTYGTDDTVAIQAGIDAVIALSRSIPLYVPSGIYMIGGALQTANNYNTQLRCGVVANPDHTPMISIQIIGEESLVGLPLNLFTQAPPTSGTILFSTLTSSTGVASVLGIPRGCGGFTGLSPICIRLENFTIRCPNNPQLSAIDFEYAMQAVVTNCKSDISREPPATLQPSNTNSTGLRMPMVNNNCLSKVQDGFTCYGYYYGLSFSEHFEADYLVILNCYRALKLQVAGHGSHVSHLVIHQCNKGIVWSGDASCVFDYVAFERGAPPGYDFSPPSWCNSTGDLDDGGNNATGQVVAFNSTSFQDSLGGAEGYLTINGCARVTVCHRAMCNGTGSAAPVVTITNTTTNQSIIACSIAGAGDYEITVNTQVNFNGLSAVANTRVRTVLYDSLAAAEIAGTTRCPVYCDVGYPVAGWASLSQVQRIRTAGPTTITFFAKIIRAGAAPTSLQFIGDNGGDDSYGSMIMGAAPVH